MNAGVDVRDTADAFVAKWRARWPEWALSQVFVPTAQRDGWAAWFALVDELLEAAWAHADPRPGEAKLGWWAQELQGWAAGARRHPLGRVLPLGHPAWTRLAAALPALATARNAASPDALRAVLPAVADALGAVDALLAPSTPPGTQAGWMAWLVVRRMAIGAVDPASAPAGGPPPADPHATRAAHASRSASDLWRAIAHARMRRGDASRPLPPWRALLTAWRTARNAVVH